MLSAFLTALRLLPTLQAAPLGPARAHRHARSTCSGRRGQDTAVGTRGRGRENPSSSARMCSSCCDPFLLHGRRLATLLRVASSGGDGAAPQGARLRARARSHCLLEIQWPRCSGRCTRGRGRPAGTRARTHRSFLRRKCPSSSQVCSSHSMARHQMSLHCAAAAVCGQRDCDGALLLRQRVSPMAAPLRETAPCSGPHSSNGGCHGVLHDGRRATALLLGLQPAEHLGLSNSRLIILSITVSYR